jgi:hypothetical protein
LSSQNLICSPLWILKVEDSWKWPLTFIRHDQKCESPGAPSLRSYLNPQRTTSPSTVFSLNMQGVHITITKIINLFLLLIFYD